MQQAIDNLQQRLDEFIDEQNARAARRPLVGMPTLKSDQDSYNGQPDEDVDLFLDRFGRYAQANQWDAQQQRRLLPTFFRGKAELWFKSLTDAQRIALNDAQLKQALRERFSSVLSQEFLRVQVNQRKQKPGESAADYAVELQKLFTGAYPALPAPQVEDILKPLYIGGLQPNVRMHVMSKEPADFAAAELAARRYESQLALVASTMEPINSISSILGTSGEGSTNYDGMRLQFLHRGYNRHKSQPRSFSRSGLGHPVCYNCNRSGHIQFACPLLRQQSYPSDNRNYRPPFNPRFGKPIGARSGSVPPHGNRPPMVTGQRQQRPANSRPPPARSAWTPRVNAVNVETEGSDELSTLQQQNAVLQEQLNLISTELSSLKPECRNAIEGTLNSTVYCFSGNVNGKGCELKDSNRSGQQKRISFALKDATEFGNDVFEEYPVEGNTPIECKPAKRECFELRKCEHEETHVLGNHTENYRTADCDRVRRSKPQTLNNVLTIRADPPVRDPLINKVDFNGVKKAKEGREIVSSIEKSTQTCTELKNGIVGRNFEKFEAKVGNKINVKNKLGCGKKRKTDRKVDLKIKEDFEDETDFEETLGFKEKKIIGFQVVLWKCMLFLLKMVWCFVNLIWKGKVHKFMALYFCIGLVQFSSASREFQLCGASHGGLVYSVPHKVKCVIPETAPVVNLRLRLFVPNHEASVTSAWRCAGKKRTICTNVGFFGSRGIVADKVEIIHVSAHECKQAIITGYIKGKSLVKMKDKMLSTNETLVVNFKWCCTDTCTSVENYILLPGQIATVDGHHLFSDLGDMGACFASTGNCDSLDGVITWDPKEIKPPCSYKEVLPKEKLMADISGKHIIITKIQGAFTLLKNKSLPSNKHCLPTHALMTDQGVVVASFLENEWETDVQRLIHSGKSPKTKLVAETEAPQADAPTVVEVDETNYKLEFLTLRVTEIEEINFREVWLNICHMASNQLQLIWQFLRIDATAGARVLLNKDDIFAKIVGEALVVWPCQNVNITEIFWDYKIEETCYQLLPIKANETIYFALPGSRDLVPNSPIIPCTHVTKGIYRDEETDFEQWRSTKGPLSVFPLPFEITWKLNQFTPVFDAPKIYLNSYIENNLYLGLTQTFFLKSMRLHQQFDHLINYTSALALDPEALRNTIKGIGEGLASVIEAPGKGIGYAITGIGSGAGQFLHKLVSGPVLLVVVIIVSIITLIAVCIIIRKYGMRCKTKRRLRSNPIEDESTNVGGIKNTNVLERIGLLKRKTKPQTQAKFDAKQEQVTLSYSISDLSKAQPNIWIQIFKRNLLALIDTGAAVSIMDQTIFEYLKQMSDIKLNHSALIPKSITGHDMQIMGEITIPINYGKKDVKATFLVVDFCANPIVLGIDNLKPMSNGKLHIDLKNNFVKFDNEMLPLINTPIANFSKQIIPIFAVNTVEIPPRTMKFVKANLTTNNVQNYMCDDKLLLQPHPNMLLKTELAIPTIFVTGITNELFVPVINSSKTATKIYAKSNIANVCSITESEAPAFQMTTAGLNQSQMYSKLQEATKHIRNKAEQDTLFKFLNQNSKVFATDDGALGCNSLIKHEIKTGNAVPINQKAYRIPHSQRPVIAQHVKEMLERKVIKPSHSPWSSPVVIVKKKDGSERFCIDYRKLNAITEHDVYPLPNINDIFDNIGNASVFSTLDLDKGYWQIKMQEDSIPKTAFTTFMGLFEFNLMPFGLCNAPSTFQRVMQQILNGIEWTFAFVYIDDILICSKNMEEHVEHLKEVFQRIEAAGMKLKLKKCNFSREEVAYLGHIITKHGIKPDPSKIASVKDFPVPIDVTTLKSFLGLTSYYRRFIPEFSMVATPMLKLLKKDNKFDWNKECQEAFEILKQKLISSPLLSYPNFEKPFIIQTDASGYGIGAVLAQAVSENETEGEKPIAFASRTLSKCEKNYTTTEKEALAIIWALKQFRPYIYGQKCILYTDHAPLRYLKATPQSSSRLTRWALAFQEYNVEIRYKPGKHNKNADALSRCPINAIVVEPNQISDKQLQDAYYLPIIKFLRKEEIPTDLNILKNLTKISNEFVIKNDTLHHLNPDKEIVLAIPQGMTNEIIEALHDDLFSSHLGFRRTLAKAKERFFWPTMSNDIFEHCQTCLECAGRKTTHKSFTPPMVPIPVGEPFERMAVDILGPFPQSYEGNKYIVVFGEYLTKWTEAFALPDAKAETVAKIFVEEIVCRHGAPKILLSDRGTNFLSQLMQEICKLCNTRKDNTTAYHPQTDGLVERFNRTLTVMLSMYVSSNQKDWDHFIPFALFAYRTAVHESTKYSPFYLVYGRNPCLPIDAALNAKVSPYNFDPDEYATNMQNKLTIAWGLAKQNINHAQEHQKQSYAQKHKIQTKVPYKTGDAVLLYNPATPIGKTKKLIHQWIGPYEIIEVCQPNVKIQRLNGNNKEISKVHMNRIKAYQLPKQLNTQTSKKIKTIMKPIAKTSFKKKVKIVPPTDRVTRSMTKPLSYVSTILISLITFLSLFSYVKPTDDFIIHGVNIEDYFNHCPLNEMWTDKITNFNFCKSDTFSSLFLKVINYSGGWIETAIKNLLPLVQPFSYQEFPCRSEPVYYNDTLLNNTICSIFELAIRHVESKDELCTDGYQVKATNQQYQVCTESLDKCTIIQKFASNISRRVTQERDNLLESIKNARIELTQLTTDHHSCVDDQRNQLDQLTKYLDAREETISLRKHHSECQRHLRHCKRDLRALQHAMINTEADD